MLGLLYEASFANEFQYVCINDLKARVVQIFITIKDILSPVSDMALWHIPQDALPPELCIYVI